MKNHILIISILFSTFSPNLFSQRLPRTPSVCQEIVCNQLPKHLCDEVSEIQTVNQICHGHTNGDCLESVFALLPRHKTDEIFEIKEIGNQCQPFRNSLCLDFFSRNLPNHKLDETSEIFETLQFCLGMSDQTIKCAEASCLALPSYKCDEKLELQNIVSNCHEQH